MTKYLVPAEDLLWLLNAVSTTAHPQKVADILSRAAVSIDNSDTPSRAGDSETSNKPARPEE